MGHALQMGRQKWNFVAFSVLFSTLHGTVDAMLAYSTAELGSLTGVVGGFALYATYTASSLLVAKPVLSTLGPKAAVLTGMSLMLIYVDMFLLAYLHKHVSTVVYIFGSIVGGVGAGILWTAEGSYYALSSRLYAAESNSDSEGALHTFASIFSGLLTMIEFLAKIIGTVMYIGTENAGRTWQRALFAAYATIALLSLVLFWVLVLPLDSAERALDYNESTAGAAPPSQHGLCEGDRDFLGDIELTSASTYPAQQLQLSPFHTQDTNTTIMRESVHDNTVAECSATGSHGVADQTPRGTFADVTAVSRLIFTDRRMQLMLPYQLCFGFSVGLVNTYVLAVVVKAHLRDGYIGLLSGITALTAGCLAAPFGLVAGRFASGRTVIMVLGALCFAYGGGVLLCFSDAELATWPSIVIFFVMHGIARGVWENTNKATIAIYFPALHERQAAFAAVSCASGLSGALGFLIFRVFTRNAVAIVNLAISIIALFSYLASTVL